MKRSRTSMAAAVVLAAGLVAVSAQPGPGHGHKRPGGFIAKELELTEEQRTKLELLRLDHKKAHVLKRPEMKRIRDKVKTELLKEKPDQGTLDKYAEEMGKLHVEMTKERHKHLLEVKEVLSAEQFEKLVEMKGRWHGCRGGHGKRSGAKCRGKK